MIVAVPVPFPAMSSEKVTYSDEIPQPVFPPSAATQFPFSFAILDDEAAASALTGARPTAAHIASRLIILNGTNLDTRNMRFLLRGKTNCRDQQRGLRTGRPQTASDELRCDICRPGARRAYVSPVTETEISVTSVLRQYV